MTAHVFVSVSSRNSSSPGRDRLSLARRRLAANSTTAAAMMVLCAISAVQDPMLRNSAVGALIRCLEAGGAGGLIGALVAIETVNGAG